MPALSKSQQRLFGMVHAIQSGKAKPGKFSKKIRNMAKRMDSEAVDHFASTETKNLPDKKDKKSMKEEKQEKKACWFDFV